MALSDHTASSRLPTSRESVLPYRAAEETVDKALNYAFVERRRKKRDFRQLWVVRINAAARLNGLSYGRLINGLKAANIALDRKSLAELAVNHPEAFAKVAAQAAAAPTSCGQGGCVWR